MAKKSTFDPQRFDAKVGHVALRLVESESSSQEVAVMLNIAAKIYRKYHDYYDGEIQGCCPLIADEISQATGAEVVAGEITFYGGSLSRTHWWAEKNGVVLDPMGDAMMDPRDYPERVEIHRDRHIFESILPQYERWRVSNPSDDDTIHPGLSPF